MGYFETKLMLLLLYVISLEADASIQLGFFFFFQIDVFTEEVIRAGPGAVLSTLVNRFDPCLRKIANLGW